MKISKLLLILSLIFSLNVNATFHHCSFHAVRRSVHHSTNHKVSSNKIHNNTSFERSYLRHTPTVHNNNKSLLRNGMLFYIISRPHHYRDTYMINDKELKRCPKCNKSLIPLNWVCCNKCNGKTHPRRYSSRK